MSGPFSKHLDGRSPQPDLRALASLLKSEDGPRKIVVLAGAGISTSAGLPDFRSPSTGLYANLKAYDLPYAEAVFDIEYFRSKPEPFFTLAKELYPGNFRPTITHIFFELLRRKGRLLRVWTQNIDTLERLAGLPDHLLVEAHGSFASSRCVRCKKEADAAWMKDMVFKGEVARCPERRCRQGGKDGKGELVKPDIVFFGEGLPERFFRQLGDMRVADLLLVLGTSLQVHPFASLPSRVRANTPRVLINLERVGEIGESLSVAGRMGMGLFSEDGFDFKGLAHEDKRDIRDVFLQGRTDDIIKELCSLCGWEEELSAIAKEIHDRLDQISSRPAQSDKPDNGEAQRVCPAHSKVDRDAAQKQDGETHGLENSLANLSVTEKPNDKGTIEEAGSPNEEKVDQKSVSRPAEPKASSL